MDTREHAILDNLKTAFQFAAVEAALAGNESLREAIQEHEPCLGSLIEAKCCVLYLPHLGKAVYEIAEELELEGRDEQ